jgi:hypothetical protein
VVLAAVATVTADRLHGRSLALHVLLASGFLIGGLALISIIAAGVSAVWQVQAACTVVITASRAGAGSVGCSALMACLHCSRWSMQGR